MGLDDIISKAKEALGGEESAEDKVDQAADFLKDKAPDQYDGTIDKVAEAAKNALDTNGQ